MNKFNRLLLCGAMLSLCFSSSIGANEIQDINKLFKQNQHTQALKRVDAYLASKPKDAQARFLKGLILTAQHKNNEAAGIFLSLTEDYPELPEPYNNLAVLYAEQGQYEKARAALEVAIRNHPNYATAQENLGDIYAKMASHSYERAAQLDRNNTSAQTKLALVNDLFPKNKPVPPVISAPKPQATAPIASSVAAKTPLTVSEPSPPAKVQPSTTGAVPSLPAKVAEVTPKPPSPAKPQVNASAPLPVHSKAVSFIPEPGEPAKNANNREPIANRADANVLKTLHDWVDVWSSQDVEKYLAFYSADFKTPNGENRNDWENSSRVRINMPKYIEIHIDNEKVTFPDENHAAVTFHQSYRSDYINSSFDKFMLLVKQNGKWLIQEERAAK